MSKLAIVESRVVHESPVHGPELLAELNRLRARETELMKNWAADDHEARMLRFDLAEIETAALAEGRPAIAHMAKEARSKTAARTSQVKRLIDAIGGVSGPDGILRGPITDGPELDELTYAYAPFCSSRPSGEF